eukprot:TRINITY_DN26340_c0_g1_i1.p1 TRINITY_DN26340_c0_g1~~TRINITY_DN26340_c0_g1_i1.p1  ORF type:complete len:446 (-),score=55.11 TRINITY_DN26340_c0_g1_i1:74-1231(-)
MAYGGTFLLTDLLSDVVDYDQLLTRGKRREASYIMALGFVPKFMGIPGEAVPIIVLPLLRYASSPWKSDIPCDQGSSSDMFCHNAFMSETAGSLLCGRDASFRNCTQLLADGITFVCNLPKGDLAALSANESMELCGVEKCGACGFKQNDDVKVFLRMCLSVVPFVFVFLSFVQLFWYPKEARSEESHECLMHAITAVKRGDTVEDPWRPGCWIKPLKPFEGRVTGALYYIWPSHLRAALVATKEARGGAIKDDDGVDFAVVTAKLLPYFLFYVLLILAGGVVFALGFQALADPQAGSVAPLGVMLSGIGITGAAFIFAQLRACQHLRRTRVSAAAVEAVLDLWGPFLGERESSHMPPTTTAAADCGPELATPSGASSVPTIASI